MIDFRLFYKFSSYIEIYIFLSNFEKERKKIRFVKGLITSRGKPFLFAIIYLRFFLCGQWFISLNHELLDDKSLELISKWKNMHNLNNRRRKVTLRSFWSASESKADQNFWIESNSRAKKDIKCKDTHTHTCSRPFILPLFLTCSLSFSLP